MHNFAVILSIVHLQMNHPNNETMYINVKLIRKGHVVQSFKLIVNIYVIKGIRAGINSFHVNKITINHPKYSNPNKCFEI